MSLDILFPTPIYKEKLRVPKHTKNKMILFFKKFYEKYKLEENTTNSITGDFLGEYKIFNYEEFFWLNSQVSEHFKKYCLLIGLPVNILDVYIQKAWPVICFTENGHLNYHRHLNSHFSVVFYLQSSPNDGGQITFECPRDNPLQNLPLMYSLNKINNYPTVSYLCEEDSILIFPSTLNHKVENYNSNLPRYSVSYDITITTKQNFARDSEYFISHPHEWMNI